MSKGKAIKDSTVRSIRVENSDWEKIKEEAKEKDKAIAQVVRERLSGGEVEFRLPLRMLIPCGTPRTMESLTAPFGDDSSTIVRGPLAKFITPNSFVGIAHGRSMEYEGIDSISNNDRLLMIPREEFCREITPGMLVLTQITYNHGSEPKVTLKKYADIGKLKANNPKSEAPVPDDDTESFEALAVCAGVLERLLI